MTALAKSILRETPTRAHFRHMLTAIGGDGGYWKPEKITAVRVALANYSDEELRSRAKSTGNEAQYQTMLEMVGAVRKQFVREIIKTESAWLSKE